MDHFVYIIHSKYKDIYYKGYSADPYKRLLDHNQNKSHFTAHKGPWLLIYLEAFESKSIALKRERQLKRQNRKYLDWLVHQPINLLNNK